MSINYYDCALKLFPTATIDDFLFADDGSGIYLAYWNEAKLGIAPTLATFEAQALAASKVRAITDIKKTRQLGLDLAAVSSGVLAIYMSNYEAAKSFLSGNPTYVTKNGMTAEAYLQGFGSHLGMTPTQFANYIVNENLRVGPTVYQVEQRYLALAYGGDPANGIYPISVLTTVDAVLSAVSAFKQFCGVTCD